MNARHAALLLAAALVLARAGDAVSIAPVIADIPAGDYVLDPAHSTISFRISHLYVSSYTAHFTRFDARLHLDPAQPDRASITTTIDPRSLALDVAPPGFRDILLGPQFLDVARFPVAGFRSTKVTLIGPDRAQVGGNFSLHGVTRPIKLMVTFAGGTRATGPAHNARVHFIVKAHFERSAFGLGYGSKLIVGDDANVVIDAQFTCVAARK